MALGYCMSCKKLVPIRVGPQEWVTRRQAWFPVPHDKPEEEGGGPCLDGPKKEIK